MKRFAIGLFVLILLSFGVVTVQAEEESQPDFRGTLDVMLGNVDHNFGVNYRLGENLMIVGEYQTDSQSDVQNNVIKAGIDFHLFDTIRLFLGSRYDPATQNSVLYNGIDFAIPFGVNLALTGAYDYNVNGVDWSRYEAALRIQAYESVYLLAGVRGETGTVPYLPVEEQKPTLFLKVDGEWVWGKVGLKIQPYLYVQGILLHDYTLEYQFSDRTSLVVNYKDTFDRRPHYQGGIRWRF
jgi:hypothetical protein